MVMIVSISSVSIAHIKIIPLLRDEARCEVGGEREGGREMEGERGERGGEEMSIKQQVDLTTRKIAQFILRMCCKEIKVGRSLSITSNSGARLCQVPLLL